VGDPKSEVELGRDIFVNIGSSSRISEGSGEGSSITVGAADFNCEHPSWARRPVSVGEGGPVLMEDAKSPA
jgi:hypothetical protein